MLKIEGRIPCYSKEIRNFVKFLNKHYKIDSDLTLRIVDKDEIDDTLLEEYDAEDVTEPNAYVFGVYIPELGQKIVSVGAFWPEHPTMILLLIGHEFAHALQHIGDRKMIGKRAEYEADSIAMRLVVEYVMVKRKL